MTQNHPVVTDQAIVDRVVARRGRLHAFTSLDPATTALVVIDLDLGTGRGEDQQITKDSDTINKIAATLRVQGGCVAWVTTPIQKATDNFRAIFGDERTRQYEASAASGESKTLWPELTVDENDIHATKEGFSAFFPGRSDLHEQLQLRGVKSVLIAGAVTNVCCDASARDAAELHYRVTMVSDALIGWSEQYNQATFATFFRCFGDVRPASEIIRLASGADTELL